MEEIQKDARALNFLNMLIHSNYIQNKYCSTLIVNGDFTEQTYVLQEVEEYLKRQASKIKNKLEEGI